GPAAKETSGDTGQPTHQEYERNRGDGDEEIKPRRHNDAAQDITAELIGAEQMGGRRRLQSGRRIAGKRVIRHDERTEYGRYHDEQKQAESKTRYPVLADDILAMA